MGMISQYWFPDELFSGMFEGFNQSYAPGGWAFIMNRGSSGATLTWNHKDGEIILPLFALLNSGPTLTAIDAMFKGATRTSDVMAKGMLWSQAPHYGADPNRHGDWDLLVRVYFNFHIETRDFCYNRDGTISYYIVPFLDVTGHFGAFVDEWEWSVSDRPDVCQGPIEDKLNKSVPGAIGTVQGFIDQLVSSVRASTFSKVFLLPGHGTLNDGAFSEDADTDVALLLAP
jgi:hypothetical protein